MTIYINRNDLQSSPSRVQTVCDEMGIRLGKDEKKAHKIICAVLNQPNWHAALSKADNDVSDLGASVGRINALAAQLLKLPFVCQIQKESLIFSVIKGVKEMKSPIDFIGSISSTVRTLDLTASHVTGGRELTSEESSLLLLNYLFAEELINKIPHMIPKGTLNELKTLSDRLSRKLVEFSTGKIACSDCGNFDDQDCDEGTWEVDPIGFTFPFDDRFEYVVCQHCGKRTLVEDWNNPSASSLEMRKDDGYLSSSDLLVELKAKFNKITNPHFDSVIASVATHKELLDLAVESRDAVQEHDKLDYFSVITELLEVIAFESGATFIPCSEFESKRISPVVNEVILYNGLTLIGVEKRIGITILKDLEGKAVSYEPENIEAEILGRFIPSANGEYVKA